MWWPNIDVAIEQQVKSYAVCQTSINDQPRSHVHVDFAGPFYGKMCLILIDAHSKWIEVCIK